MAKSAKIATFNANSIRVRLEIVLKWLKKVKPDVLAIQETKAQDQDFPKEAFIKAGWQVLFRGQKSYNGVAFVSKKPLKNERLFLKEPNEEARYLSADFEGIRLINTYVPQGYTPDSPKFQKKLRFFGDLKNRFGREVKNDQPALWMGDFNVAPTEIDLWDPVRNQEHVCFHPKARKALEEVKSTKWVDLFREKVKGPGHYTFWDYLHPTNLERNRGWRIDHIFGTKPMVPRLEKIWVDIDPRKSGRPSDHTFLVAQVGLS